MDGNLPEEHAQLLVKRAFGAPVASIDPMPGGASTRRYFRVHVDTTPRRSAILMFAPEGAKPEEVTKGGETARWPFLEVGELLGAAGVRVPKVLGEDTAHGLLMLEDLGDVTLAEALKIDPSRRRALYERAVRDLAAMHAALEERTKGTIVATRAFDETLLRWELAHFVEYGLDARGVTRSKAAREALDSAFDEIARELSARPRGFVHRDYQSRNLMLDPEGPARGDRDALVVIDFQDALLGPRAYDLVALLRDSYQDLSEDFVSDMIARYGDERSLDAASRASLRDEFDRLTVQRKLKDAGRFVFIERKKNDPSFLPYFAPSLVRVRHALARLADEATFARVSELLAEALPEHFGS